MLFRSSCNRQMLANRDIQSDIGKETPTSAKTTPEIIISNFSRLGEALRSIAEYLKTEMPRLVKEIERLRFEAYQLQQEFFFILYPKKGLERLRLYVLVPGVWNEKIIRDLIKGGVGAIQLRAECLDDKELLKLAIKLRKITRAHQVLFIINNRIDIALLSNADGVHLGATDCSIRDARRILGPDKIIGATSHSIAEALAAQRNGADYFSVGPMFSSPTKPHLAPAGFSYLKEVAKKIHIPYVAIGGITAGNLPVLLKAHKKLFKEPLRIAVSSGILNTNNIYKATRQIAGILNHKGCQ